ncbi:MAG TPA: phosphoribosylaminoimidazolesuccinocarboxamide synthase, partial [Symbiobacteriaceae bacterium]|nr:phosphoribosylaminoimidazolesuccinocarboxamide synthase [Symbiobacteriaceae bacterium]
MTVLLSCPELGLRRIHKGKVREMFELPDDRLLLVASDRLSAFDVVFPQGIPGKGRVLTQLSVLWF